MLIHPWDAALDAAEWQDWLASTDRFGMLAVSNLDPARAPLVLPLHFTVAGDVVAGFDVDKVSSAQQTAGYIFKSARRRVAFRNRLALGLAQRVGLRLAAALGHGFGKVGEQHSEPQPQRDLKVESEAGAVVDGVVDEQRGS